MKRILKLLASLFIVLTVAGCSQSESASITSLDDVGNSKIGVQTGTGYDTLLLEKCPDAQILTFSDVSGMYMSLNSNKIDAFVAESSIESDITSQYENFEYLKDEAIAVQDISIAVGDNETLLLAQLNDFIDKCNEDGTTDALIDRWLNNFDSENTEIDRTQGTGEKIVVAFEGGFIPYSFISNNIYTGYDIDFIYRFARAYNYQVELLPVSYDSIPTALKTGKANLGMNIIVDEERAESLTFTKAYSHQSLYLVINNGEVTSSGFSIDSIIKSFEKTFLKENRWQMFADGLLMTVKISLISIVLGTIFGILIYLLCFNSKSFVTRIFDRIFGLLDKLPTVLLLLVFYYIIFGNSTLSADIVSIVLFTILFTSIMYSAIQTGVKAIGVGQYEAALAQGFTKNQAFRKIIFPQVIKYISSIYKDGVISIIAETSIVGYIAVQDLTKATDLVRAVTFEAFFPLISSAIIYLIFIDIILLIVSRLEFNFFTPEKRSKKKILKGIKEHD